MHQKMVIEQLAKEKSQPAEKWRIAQLKKIACFGYQNGLSSDAASKYAEEVLIAALNQLKEEASEVRENRFTFLLYTVAVNKIAAYSFEPKQDEMLILFEEDRQLHLLVLKLQSELRMPLILQTFHDMSAEQAAAVLDVQAENAAKALFESKERLADSLQLSEVRWMEKKLTLLAKSYDRIFFKFSDWSEDLAETEHVAAEDAAPLPAQPPLQKAKLIAIITAGIFLSSVIGVSYLANSPQSPPATGAEEENKLNLDEQTMENWKREYQEIRARQPGKLGMDSETFDRLNYVKEADDLFKQAVSKETAEQFREEPEKAEEMYQAALMQLKSPYGMIKSLSEQPLAPEEVKPFIKSIALKTSELRQHAELILKKHEKELGTALFKDELPLERLSVRKSEYPEEVQQLLNSLNEQMLTVAVHPNENRFIIRKDFKALENQRGIPYAPEDYAYMYLLGKEPYFDQTGFLLPSEEIPYLIGEMERLLVDIEREPVLYAEIEFLFQHSFWLLLKGVEEDEIFNAEGTVKKEVRTQWNSLLETATANPIIYLLLPIYEEMEESGWTQSNHYSRLMYRDVLMAVEQEKFGELARLLPGGQLEVGTELYDLEMENDIYASVKPLYDEFSSDYDVELLKEVSAAHTYLLYRYANFMNDPVTMWHLLADDHLKPDLQSFVADWQQEPELAEIAYSLEFNENYTGRTGRTRFVQAQISYKGEEQFRPPGPLLITAPEGVWKVKHQQYESYDLTERPNAFLTEVRSLYETFSSKQEKDLLKEAKPGYIAAMYLYASEQKDFKTMYALIDNEFSGAPAVSQEVFTEAMSGQEEMRLSDYSKLTFYTDSYAVEEEIIWGRVFLPGIGESYAHGAGMYYDMIKRPEGWKIQYFSNQ